MDERNTGPTESSAQGSAQQPISQSQRTYIASANMAPRRVAYYEVDGLAVLEGDIVLGEASYVAARTKLFDVAREAHPDVPDSSLFARGLIRVGASYRWPGPRIPFQFEDNFPERTRVDEAIKEWKDRTRMEFVERTEENADSFPDYVEFVEGTSCLSNLGMKGGRQAIHLGDGCERGQVIHEIGHAVGLWHENSREDRDSYVRINLENVEMGKEDNFNQWLSASDDAGNYDYGSIMHYGRNFFAKDPSIDTITPIDEDGNELPNQVIGQRDRLSRGDIDAVFAMYPQLIANLVRVPYVLHSRPVFARRLVVEAGLVPIVNGPLGQNAYVFSQSPLNGYVDIGSEVRMRTRGGQIP